MPEKKSFLLLSLKERKLKKIADAINSDTAQKILDFIAEKGSATETEIASALQLPLSTVHYNLKNLVESTLVSANEFHYSEKGKEVNHYSLSNKYIIIAPAVEEGSIKNKLKHLVFTLLTVVGAAYLISLFKQQNTIIYGEKIMARAPEAAEGLMTAGAGAESTAVAESTPQLLHTFFQTNQIVLWFIAGALFAIVIYLLIGKVQEFYSERKGK